jgi:pentapeptide MXKDX repeat protein
MKKLVVVCFVVAFLASGIALAQDTMKQDTMKSDKMSAKSASISGKISEDGKSFVSDKDGKSWTISNPDSVKGHEGHHVVVKGHADEAKNEIQVTSLKMAKESNSKDEMKK